MLTSGLICRCAVFALQVEDINSKFAEAREEIDLAMEAKDTVFFNEEALGAKKLVSC